MEGRFCRAIFDCMTPASTGAAPSRGATRLSPEDVERQLEARLEKADQSTPPELGWAEFFVTRAAAPGAGAGRRAARAASGRPESSYSRVPPGPLRRRAGDVGAFFAGSARAVLARRRLRLRGMTGPRPTTPYAGYGVFTARVALAELKGTTGAGTARNRRDDGSAG